MSTTKCKQEWLFQLRRCTSRDTLEKVIEANRYKLTDDEMTIFNSAADHRLAEIIMNRLYDKIPATVWTYVK
uniref:hemolysin expression modulator Hha n=1 Tax=Scandinavium goeteborgense TaxID=1851514 RepID=UPI001359AEDF|nr:hemolysin expression modulator Hha [Scandinavium goeteborgense]